MVRRRFRTIRPAAFDHGEPIARASSGPIAGILLVVSAIVMLGLPPKTHALYINLPPPLNFEAWPEWLTPPPVDRISVNVEGQIRWNGTPVDRQQLVDLVEATRAETRQPGLIFEPADDAAYGEALQVLGLLHSMGATSSKFCLAGLVRNRQYELPAPIRPPVAANPDRNTTMTVDDECVDAILWHGLPID